MLKINPVFHKEILSKSRNAKTALIVFIYNCILALFGLFALYVAFQNNGPNQYSSNYSTILNMYAIISMVEFILILFIIPAITGATIAGEREKQTLEILLTTRLSPIKIIFGKLASSIHMVILLALSSLPVLALVFTIGGISILDLINFIVIVVVTAIYIGSIGIFFSTVFKRTTAATVSAYISVLVLCIGTIGVIWAIHSCMQLNINYGFADASYVPRADVGNWLAMLLLNPIITCAYLIDGQIGTDEVLRNYMSKFGMPSVFMRDHWIIFSVFLQLVVSGIFIYLSAKLLNPIETERKSKKEKI